MVIKNYDRYTFTRTDWLTYVAIVAGQTGMISYLFFDSVKAAFLCVPIGLLQYKKMKRQQIARQKKQLCVQFRSLMESIVTSLTAGYSLEHSFSIAAKDLKLLYEENADIFPELDRIQYGLDRNIPIAELVMDFGRRSGTEDIENFANVIRAAKQNGGNLIRIIQKTVNSISDKMMVEEEIQTMIAAKKLEEKIMMVMPYGILLYLRVSNGDFLQVLYHNLIGAGIMLLFLIGVNIAGMWAEKIMEISI